MRPPEDNLAWLITEARIESLRLRQKATSWEVRSEYIRPNPRVSHLHQPTTQSNPIHKSSRLSSTSNFCRAVSVSGQTSLHLTTHNHHTQTTQWPHQSNSSPLQPTLSSTLTQTQSKPCRPTRHLCSSIQSNRWSQPPSRNADDHEALLMLIQAHR